MERYDRQLPALAEKYGYIAVSPLGYRADGFYGYSYQFDTGLRAEPGAGPLWARMTELDTDRPIFSNRDGVKLYDWNQLTDRRSGYGWYTYAPVAALRQYERWARKHPARVIPSEGA